MTVGKLFHRDEAATATLHTMRSHWSSRNKGVALSLRGLRIINLAAVLCIRCRREMLTADVPDKSALQ